MMRFLSRSPDARARRARDAPVCYDSVLNVESKAMPGVTFAIHRISFGRRIELSRRVRELSQKAEFVAAGNQLQEKIEANILAQEIDGIYLRWGLLSIDGLKIDGEPASASNLIDAGPEELLREIVDAIKQQCGLSDAERKN